MTLQQKLDAMNTAKTAIMLYSGRVYSGLDDQTTWHVDFNYEDKDEGFKFQTENFPTLEEAVDAAYDKFQSITRGYFEVAIPPQLTHAA